MVRACCDFAHRPQEPIDVHGLGEVFLEPGGQGAAPILFAGQGRQCDGRHLRVGRCVRSHPRNWSGQAPIWDGKWGECPSVP